MNLEKFNKIIKNGDVFVVAEIGKNFIQTKEDKSVGEYLENAKNLVDAAVECGADAVKFQTHEVEDEQLNINIISPHFKGSDRYSWVKRNTLATPFDLFWVPLKKHCESRGIILFSTPMSRLAAKKINNLDLPLWKVGSGDLEDYLLLDYVTGTGKPVIISTGMVSFDELDKVLQNYQNCKSSFIILYCISKYPCPKEEFNLSTIELLSKKYPDLIVGFSDHSIGSEVSLAAVGCGARVIEKHFSLSRDLWGSDHKVSMTPPEMKEMIEKVRSHEYKKIDERPYYGVADKELEGSKNMFRPYFNKSIVAGREIKAGTVLKSENVYSMRPRKYIKGLPSDKIHDILGKRVNRDLKKYEPITLEKLKHNEK